MKPRARFSACASPRPRTSWRSMPTRTSCGARLPCSSATACSALASTSPTSASRSRAPDASSSRARRAAESQTNFPLARAPPPGFAELNKLSRVTQTAGARIRRVNLGLLRTAERPRLASLSLGSFLSRERARHDRARPHSLFGGGFPARAPEFACCVARGTKRAATRARAKGPPD